MIFQFKKGFVTQNKDKDQSGFFYALIYGEHYLIVDDVIVGIDTKNPLDLKNVKGKPVRYTSPYFDKHHGGMFAIPNPGSEILLLYDEDLREYYYISTIVDHSVLTGLRTPTPQKIMPLKNVYTPDGIPMAVTFTDHKGAGLKVSNYYHTDKESGKVTIDPNVSLKSTLGHKVLLSDSPDLDCVIVRNRAYDGITITNRPTLAHPANSIQVMSKGPQMCVVRDSSYLIAVTDGRDINIINSSTGAKAPRGNPRRSGNINLLSKHRDISILTDGDDGNIFIKTTRNVIQISSGGQVNIYSDSDINISTGGSLDMVANGNINIKGKNVNIESVTNINLKANSKIKAAGSSGMDLGDGSSPLHLNRIGGARPSSAQSDIFIPEKQTNAYGK